MGHGVTHQGIIKIIIGSPQPAELNPLFIDTIIHQVVECINSGITRKGSYET